MQAKKPKILLVLLTALLSLYAHAQEIPLRQPENTPEQDSLTVNLPDVSNAVQDSTVTDSVKASSFLTDKIRYKATQYIRMSRADQRIYLYDQAEVYYENYELKAGVIVIDYTTNEVYAGRIKDTAGNYSQTPYFKQGNNVVEPDSIRFNFKTKKALIFNSRSEQSVGEVMNVFAQTVKKENDSVYYLKEGKLTTSEDAENPDYYIRIRNGKFVPKKKIIAGFSNMYIADVPTPIAVPFAYFPLNQEKSSSGIILPTPGQTNLRGYSLQNGGYYFAISEYFDLALLGDYYTNGSYGLRAESSYAQRYRFRGGVRFRYENLINSQLGFPDYSRNTIYNIQWNHSQDPKSNPNSRLSASVNFGSSQYYQQSVNQLNTSNFLDNTLQSSVSYNKTFPGYPLVNLNVTSNLSQNTRTQAVNITLPSVQASMERIFPFASKTGSKKGILQNINFQYSGRGENRINTVDTLLFKSEMFDDAKVGFQHSIPISTNFKLFKYFSTTVGMNYNEVWQLKTIERNDYDPITGIQPIDTLNGFDRFATYNLSASLGTTLYGTFNFGEENKIQAIRHTVRPSVSYGYSPAYDQYYEEYLDENGVQRYYTRFENGIFGVPGRIENNNLSLSVSNVLEAKVRDRDTMQTEPKKLMLLNNLNFSTGYNFVADSLQVNPVRMSGGTQFFDNKMQVNFNATLDPYAINNSGVRINTFNIDNGGSLFRLTNANMNMRFSLNSKMFEKNNRNGRKSEETQEQEVSDDDLFGGRRDFSDRRTMADDESSSGSAELTAYRSKIPWDFQLAYSLTYSNARRESEISNNSLMFNGNVELTPQWRVGISSGYDFKQKGVTFTRFRFARDLKTWKIDFDWVPFSSRASWFFFIGIKSSILSDLKWEQRSEPDRRL